MNDRLAIMQQIQSTRDHHDACLTLGRMSHRHTAIIGLPPLCSIGPGGLGNYTQNETPPCPQQPKPQPSPTTSSGKP